MMNRQQENIDLFIRRVFTLGLFLLLLLVFRGTVSAAGSCSESSTIENTFETGTQAILIAPFPFPGFDNSLVSCGLFTSYKHNNSIYRIICANNRSNQLLLLSKKRFIEIKTHLVVPGSHQVQASLDTGEFPLIS